GIAADAATLARIALVEHDAHGHRERTPALPGEPVDDLLDARLVAERRMAVGRTRGRLGGIAAAQPMHLIEVLGLRVVRFEIVVRDRPGGRNAAVVAHRTEVLAPQADQRGAVELGVAADAVVGAGMELLAGAV